MPCVYFHTWHINNSVIWRGFGRIINSKNVPRIPLSIYKNYTLGINVTGLVVLVRLRNSRLCVFFCESEKNKGHALFRAVESE